MLAPRAQQGRPFVTIRRCAEMARFRRADGRFAWRTAAYHLGVPVASVRLVLQLDWMTPDALARLALIPLALVAAPASAAEPGVDDFASLLSEPVYGSSRLAGASKYDQDLGDAPSLVYVRTAGEIRAQGYRTLADVLESIPGVHLRHDRAYTYVGVRGVNPPGDYSARLLVLIDGVRVNEAIYDSATLGREFPLDIGLIERVEFIPGPGSALYGSNAVLGVVNVITRAPSQRPGLNAAIEGSGGGRGKFALTWGGDAGPVRLLVGAAVERSDGRDLYFPEFDAPQTNDGWAVGQDGERIDKLHLKARWSDWTFAAQLSDREKRDPTGSYGTIFNTRSDSSDRYALANLTYGRALGPQRELHGRIGVARYLYAGYGRYDQEGLVVPSVTRSEAEWIAGELRHVWSGWTGHRVLVGLEFQDNRQQAISSADLEPAPYVYSDLRLQSTRYSLFVNDEWQPAPDWRLNLGLRVDRRLDGEVTTTPRAALSWTPVPQWTLKLVRGSAFREPNISETRYTDGLQLPNTLLRVESLTSTEVAALWRPRPEVELSVALHDLRIEDLITLVGLPDGSQQYQNLGAVRSRGVQAEATWEPGAGVQWRASWSRQQARDADGAPLSDAPLSLFKMAVTAPLPWAGTRIGANLERVGTRRTLAGAELPPYAQLNLQLNHAPPGQRWSLGLGVVNLTNRQYADPAGPEHLQDTLAQDGREFVVRAGWSF
jgi:outer membrane receptor protein involved in Fe transport